MDKNKLTLSNCLRFIADNIDKEGKLYLRVGAVLLDFGFDETGEEPAYCVYDKEGKKTYYADLIEAINYFIGVVLCL